jgi:hypothetical protein
MKSFAAKLVLTGAAAALLTGCGGSGGGGDVVVAPPPPPSASLEDIFGTGFGSIFRASANSDPREPSTADVNAVSFTTDPIAVP